MNWPILVSGLAAVFCTLGHFTVGGKQYLKWTIFVFIAVFGWVGVA